MKSDFFDKGKVLLLALVLLQSFCLAQDSPFITTWEASSDNAQISFPVYGSNITIDWGDGNEETLTSANGSAYHTYSTAGSYSVEITGGLTHIRFPNGYQSKIESVDQWGDITWTTMEGAFEGCYNLHVLAIDAPDLSGVTSLESMFEDARAINEDISHWDVSTIENMIFMFNGASDFNQPLNAWDVSGAKYMGGMFRESGYNQPLDQWDVSSVESMSSMFYQADFNQPLDDWDVSNVTSMGHMFRNARYNQPLNNWEVSKVSNMSYMFYEARSFNQPIDQWDVSEVTDMSFMFEDALDFNQSIEEWDVSKVTTMYGMFKGAEDFNQPLNSWNVSKVTNLDQMFSTATDFNQPLDEWDVSAVTNMGDLFRGASSFNQPLESWDVSSVTDMSFMFYLATEFDQPLNDWDVSQVTDMMSMFGYSSFNQPLDQWDVSKVTNMGSPNGYANRGMFAETPFNQDISDWDVSSVIYMEGMFYGADDFNQDISGWDISTVADFNDFLTGAASFDRFNYDDMLEKWSQLTLKANLVFDAPLANFCDATTARSSIITDFNWTINDNGEDCTIVKTSPNLSIDALDDFIYGEETFELKWQTDSDGTITSSSSDTNVLSIDDDHQVTITGAGQSTLTISQAESETHLADEQHITVTVEKANLKITAVDQSIKRFEEIPQLTMVYEGFVNGDSEEDIVPPSISTDATSESEAGNYDIDLSGGDAENYELTLVSGTMTVTYILNVEDNRSRPGLIYPNPVSSEFRLTNRSTFDELRIVDSKGNPVRIYDSSESTFDISDLAPGAYFIQFRINNQTQVSRLLKK